MRIETLTNAHLDRLLEGAPVSTLMNEARKAYFSSGSVAKCLLEDDVPVFAGGIVDMAWRRGEVWMMPTPYFQSHVKTCLKVMKDVLPIMAIGWGFRRVQATCLDGVSRTLFGHLGFTLEGTLNSFGPTGETCTMYARVFRGD